LHSVGVEVRLSPDRIKAFAHGVVAATVGSLRTLTVSQIGQRIVQSGNRDATLGKLFVSASETGVFATPNAIHMVLLVKRYAIKTKYLLSLTK